MRGLLSAASSGQTGGQTGEQTGEQTGDKMGTRLAIQDQHAYNSNTWLRRSDFAARVSNDLAHKDLEQIAMAFPHGPRAVWGQIGDTIAFALGLYRWFSPRQVLRINTWHPSKNAVPLIG